MRLAAGQTPVFQHLRSGPPHHQVLWTTLEYVTGYGFRYLVNVPLQIAISIYSVDELLLRTLC